MSEKTEAPAMGVNLGKMDSKSVIEGLCHAYQIGYEKGIQDMRDSMKGLMQEHISLKTKNDALAMESMKAAKSYNDQIDALNTSLSEVNAWYMKLKAEREMLVKRLDEQTSAQWVIIKDVLFHVADKFDMTAQERQEIRNAIDRAKNNDPIN